MHFEFEHLGTPTSFELAEGEHLLGGGADDQVRLEGLPPGWLTLRIQDGRLMVEARRSFTVEGVPVPPGVPRLVSPGEVVGLGEGMHLRLPSAGREQARQVGTVAVLKHLLVDLDAPLSSRAATLQCLTGAEVGRTFALAEAVTVVGRGWEAAVRLRDRAVSRRHACIRAEADGFVVEDEDSPNGVFVNGQRVDAPRVLRQGDVLEVGRTLLRFQAAVEDQAPLPEASPPEEPAPVPLPPPAKSRAWEPWVLGLGIALSLMGGAATWALTR
ncbi:FHA domain-containing protein [Archangium primigenium]|uniref:FHA domain-containing protein n=1 Tax=[Archangium] primigenium TaxID=2792470 RepID=UPI001958E2B4|nr:FHA domain-containing protein [Archangium primigenium]MBM7114930.1 FHA domain-containing protein [Archangium primigenium]